MRRLAHLLVAAAFVAGLGAQSPSTPQQNSSAPVPSGLIVGRVLDATANTPIANVVVGLAGPSLPRAINVLTDGQGRFVFRSVPKGAFTLRATIGGYGYSPSGFL